MDAPDLTMIYMALEERLARVDFEAIWPGFQPAPFALYLDEVCCFQGELIPRPDVFIGNTALDYEGSTIAIWNMASSRVEGADSLDLLAGSLVHEIFHVHQKTMGEKRFPKDLDLLLYPHSRELTAWTRKESSLLAEGGENPLADLAQLAFIRREKDRLSGGATADEYRAETAEGLAEYAGLMALSQLNSGLARQQIEKYKGLLGDGSYLFDIRRRCYFSGVLLALLVGEAGLPLVHDLGSDKSFWELLAIPAGETEPMSEEDLEAAHTLMAKESQRKAVLLADFSARFPHERPVSCQIIGYDPMNLTRVGDYLLSSHFLMTDEKAPPLPMMGDRMVRMKAGDPRQLEAVYEQGQA